LFLKGVGFDLEEFAFLVVEIVFICEFLDELLLFLVSVLMFLLIFVEEYGDVVLPVGFLDLEVLIVTLDIHFNVVDCSFELRDQLDDFFADGVQHTFF
jgi:hypothetical protein